MIYELFSARERRLSQSGSVDVYQYDSVPDRLRVQVQQILTDAIGPQYVPQPYALSSLSDNAEGWRFIDKTLRREMGLHELASGSTERSQVLNYLAKANASGFLDVVELCARYIDRMLGKFGDYERSRYGIEQDAESALEELNHRFRGAGFGYQYDSGQMLRMDSEYTHEEIVKPALRLLSGQGFEGAQAEFLLAHRLYRASEYPQAITEAAKAFESTLKAVCDLKGWSYEKGARASDLLRRVRAEGLWPDYLDASFDQLLATLASGLPRIRNEEGAHGQGAAVKVVPRHVASYALNLAAAKVAFVCEAAQYQA